MRIRYSTVLILTLTLGSCGRSKQDSLAPIADFSRPFEEIAPASFDADDWPGWRGPLRNGTVLGTGPIHWSETDNVIWKTKVPGRGHGSPTVAAGAVYLATAEDDSQTQSMLAYDRATGRQLWRTVLNTGGFPEPHQTNYKSTNANGTVACDGERLFIAFLHHEAVTAYAIDLAGHLLWEQPLGPFDSMHGYAPSPQVHGSLVVISADHRGGGFLAGLHRETGEVIWTKTRPHYTSCSSAVVATFGSDELLLIGGGEMLAAYDPTSGSELWSTPGLTETTCGTCVWDAERIYASGGYPRAQTMAVTREGRPVWTNSAKCYETSLLLHDGHLFAVNDSASGIAYCWDAATGEEMWKHRLRDHFSASPIIADGNIYVSNEAGQITIFEAASEAFTLVTENKLGDETFATPTICGGRLYHRIARRDAVGRQEWLYCIGDSDAG